MYGRSPGPLHREAMNAGREYRYFRCGRLRARHRNHQTEIQGCTVHGPILSSAIDGVDVFGDRPINKSLSLWERVG